MTKFVSAAVIAYSLWMRWCSRSYLDRVAVVLKPSLVWSSRTTVLQFSLWRCVIRTKMFGMMSGSNTSIKPSVPGFDYIVSAMSMSTLYIVLIPQGNGKDPFQPESWKLTVRIMYIFINIYTNKKIFSAFRSFVIQGIRHSGQNFENQRSAFRAFGIPAPTQNYCDRCQMFTSEYVYIRFVVILRSRMAAIFYGSNSK